LLPLVLLFPSLAAAQSGKAPVSVLVMGDSLSAAYGMSIRQGWAALFEQRLQRERPGSRVTNASISGETTQGGLTRLPAELDRARPDIVILQLGANDGLRGQPVEAMRDNLLQMTRLSQRAGARVLILGMHIPPNYGPAYTTKFHQAFADVAKQTRSGHVPFFLDGIALDPQLIQADGLHPTASAQPKLLETVWRALQPQL